MQDQLITLLVKVGVIAAIASFGVRSAAVKRMLLRDERTLRQRVMLSLWFLALFAPGEIIRVLSSDYNALDLALEGSVLAGLMGGYVSGMLSGILLSIPAMIKGEFLSLTFYAAAGLGGGLLRDSASSPDDVWRFSPFPDVNLYRIFEPGRELRSALFHAYFSAAAVAIELLRQLMGREFGGRQLLFTTVAWGDSPLLLLAAWLSTYFCITIPVKVWNSTRNEAQLEEQSRLLLTARLEMLSSQINPHFLFNTLNSIASLIRVNPERARTMVVRLARIMRRRLRTQDHFSPLRDELDFIGDYLAIELERFGDKLRVVREIDPSCADVPVPSMLLQPLVENSIKHGIANRIEGGTITLRARRAGDRLSIEVEDDGVGIPENATDEPPGGTGIGVSNVRERLQVLYSHDYTMAIESQPGQGTRVSIDIPAEAAAIR
ncbi:MAG TPA: histidine kinase [Bryobacteraceae bacterium]|nr:histidine kinase [Bryobacteraceae bacterium]